LADWHDAVDEYRRELAEVETMLVGGKAVKMYCLDELEPELCYKHVVAKGSCAGSADVASVVGAGGTSGATAQHTTELSPHHPKRPSPPSKRKTCDTRLFRWRKRLRM
jgi:hypothetical protein